MQQLDRHFPDHLVVIDNKYRRPAGAEKPVFAPRLLAFVGLGIACRPRQIDQERGPFADLAHHLDIAAVLLHYAVDGGQPEPGAVPYRFCRVERLEDVAQHLLAHAAAVIGERQQHMGTRLHARIELGELVVEHHVACFDDYGAVAGYGVLRIDGEVHQDLLDLAAIGKNIGAQRGEIGLDLDVGTDRSLHQIEQRHDDHVQFQQLHGEYLLAPEGEQLLGEVRSLVSRQQDAFDSFPIGISGAEIALDDIGVDKDRGQQVVEVVGQASGQLPDRLDLLHLPHLFFQLRPALVAANPTYGDARHMRRRLDKREFLLSRAPAVAVVDGKGPQQVPAGGQHRFGPAGPQTRLARRSEVLPKRMGLDVVDDDALFQEGGRAARPHPLLDSEAVHRLVVGSREARGRAVP